MFMTNQPSHVVRTEKDGFSNSIVKGDARICGAVSVMADNIEAEISDIKVTDNETGKVSTYNGMSLSGRDEADICDVASGHYTIEFTAKRLSGDLGFKLTFAKKADRIKHVWAIGGWQNQDTLIDKFEGHASCLTQSRFSVETGVSYRLKLEVDGRMLRTYINGKLWNEVEDKQLVQEELYYTAGIDEPTGDVIIKAVNVNDTPTAGTIEIPFMEKLNITISELSGYDRDDKNSFDEPEKISPKESYIKIDTNSFEYEFKPMSVTVFRII